MLTKEEIIYLQQRIEKAVSLSRQKKDMKTPNLCLVEGETIKEVKKVVLSNGGMSQEYYFGSYVFFIENPKYGRNTYIVSTKTAYGKLGFSRTTISPANYWQYGKSLKENEVKI